MKIIKSVSFFLSLSQRSQLHLRQQLTAATRSRQVSNTEHILMILEQNVSRIKCFYDMFCCFNVFLFYHCVLDLLNHCATKLK